MWNTKIIDFIMSELHGNSSLFKETPFYRGDPNIRKGFLSYEYTTTETSALLNIESVTDFIRYVPIESISGEPSKLFEYQTDFIETFRRNRKIVVMKSRQMGIGVIMAILALHSAKVNNNQNILYISPSSGGAEEFINKVKAFYFKLPFFMKPGVVAWNAKSIEFDNGSRIVAKSAESSTISGGVINTLFIDDAANIKNLSNVISNTINGVSNDKESRVVVASSPNGIEKFYEIFTGAERCTNEFYPVRMHWSQRYNADWAKRMMHDMGKDAFEAECNFVFTTKNEQKQVVITEDDVETLLNVPTNDYLLSEIKRLEDNLKKLKQQVNGRK